MQIVFSLVWMIRHYSWRRKCRRQRWALKVETAQCSAVNVKCSSWVRVCESQRACMRLILITFYKNINDKMFTSAVSELVQFEWIRFYWHLFASVLVASVNPALESYQLLWIPTPKVCRKTRCAYSYVNNQGHLHAGVARCV